MPPDTQMLSAWQFPAWRASFVKSSYDVVTMTLPQASGRQSAVPSVRDGAKLMPAIRFERVASATTRKTGRVSLNRGHSVHQSVRARRRPRRRAATASRPRPRATAASRRQPARRGRRDRIRRVRRLPAPTTTSASPPTRARRRCDRESLAEHGVGAGAARLISGNTPEHEALEAELAEFFGAERALTFSSGYAANVGIIPALVGRGDVIFADALNHASLIDGCRLSRADVHVYPHGDVAALAALLDAHRASARRALIVSDGLFSMDGDVAPLADLVDLARRFDAWTYVDDAHAVGVVGDDGRGIGERRRLPRSDRRHRRHARQGVRRGRRVRLRIVDARAVSDQSRALVRLLHGHASRAGGGRARSAAHRARPSRSVASVLPRQRASLARVARRGAASAIAAAGEADAHRARA